MLLNTMLLHGICLVKFFHWCLTLFYEEQLIQTSNGKIISMGNFPQIAFCNALWRPHSHERSLPKTRSPPYFWGEPGIEHACTGMNRSTALESQAEAVGIHTSEQSEHVWIPAAAARDSTSVGNHTSKRSAWVWFPTQVALCGGAVSDCVWNHTTKKTCWLLWIFRCSRTSWTMHWQKDA